jgi:hypothetical protein
MYVCMYKCMYVCMHVCACFEVSVRELVELRPALCVCGEVRRGLVRRGDRCIRECIHRDVERECRDVPTNSVCVREVGC